jgi:hypothetical protein
LAEQKIVKKTKRISKYIVHNVKNLGHSFIKGESMPVETTSTVDAPSTPEARSYHRIFSLLGFLFGLARNLGLFLFGVFIGLGIALRDPMPDKKNIAIIEKLQIENNSLKTSLKKQEDEIKNPVFSEIKDGVIIGR